MAKMTRLRNNEKARQKIQSIVSEWNEGSDRRMSVSSDSDEYVPHHQPRLCDVAGCQEDIIIACQQCPSFVCYDHISTTCNYHKRITVTASDKTLCSDGSSDESDTLKSRSRKRKRTKR